MRPYIRIRCFILLLCLFFGFSKSWGQAAPPEKFQRDDNQVMGIKLGYLSSKGLELGVGYSFLRTAAGVFSIPEWNLAATVSGETYIIDKTWKVAPKIMLEAHFLDVVGLRTSFVQYKDSEQNLTDQRITLEGGLTLFGLIDVFYAHGFALQEKTVSQVPTDRVNVSLNIPLYWVSRVHVKKETSEK